MHHDERGLELTTSRSEAAEGVSRTAVSFVTQKQDTMVHLNAALEADAGCVLAHAIKGLLIVGNRQPRRYPEARAALEAAESAGAGANEREKGYIAALTAALGGHTLETVSHYETILQAYPLDLMAHRLAALELFWIGEVGWMRNIAERAAGAWSSDTPGVSGYLSMRAFGCEENGQFADAERYGREAIDHDPTNGWGAHAVAHVMEMQGRHDEGVAWLDGLKDQWSNLNNFVHHLWWHRTLFHTQRAEFDAVLDIYDRYMRNPESPLVKAMPDHFGDFQNCVDLLKHLELYGVDVGGRWEPIADLAEDRIGNLAAPLSSAHAATPLAAAGRDAAISSYLASMRDFAATDETNNGARVRTAVLPAAEGAIAHQRGNHERVLEILLPARRSLWQMGGSHAQRDLFSQILADSARRLGRQDVVNLLLEELAQTGFANPLERLGLPNPTVH